MGNYSDELIEQMWDKAKVIDGYDSNRWRQDFAGAWIKKDQYGIQSTFGWEIDHLTPVSQGGTDDVSNLNPLQWENNRTKGDDYPIFNTSVSSDNNKKVYKKRSWRIS